MRNERSYPWGLDSTDPRLDLRRAAADAQREMDAVEPPDQDERPLDDTWTTDAEEWEPAMATGERRR